MNNFRCILAAAAFVTALTVAPAIEKIARTPYIGAMVIDVASGQVLFEDNADAPGYPASVTKLMTFFVVMDKVHSGQLTLETPITVSAEASHIGGSRVYLKQGEVFTVDDLLYAMMIQSANDAAFALAVHAAGSRDAFVELMNTKARQLGMKNTTFHSPHGLPPGKGQQADVSTAHDLALLSRELINHGDILRYSSVKVRMFRANTANPFRMENHNHLLGKLAGCDGLKTGYFAAAGSSLSATVERNGRRILAVVVGSDGSKTRDLKMMELVERGFAALPAATPSVKVGAASAPPSSGQAKPPVAKAEEVPVVTTDKSAHPVVSSTPKPGEQSSTAAEPMFKLNLNPKK